MYYILEKKLVINFISNKILIQFFSICFYILHSILRSVFWHLFDRESTAGTLMISFVDYAVKNSHLTRGKENGAPTLFSRRWARRRGWKRNRYAPRDPVWISLSDLTPRRDSFCLTDVSVEAIRNAKMAFVHASREPVILNDDNKKKNECRIKIYTATSWINFAHCFSWFIIIVLGERLFCTELTAIMHARRFRCDSPYRRWTRVL